MSNTFHRTQPIRRGHSVKSGDVVCLSHARPTAAGGVEALAPGDLLDAMHGNVFVVSESWAHKVDNPNYDPNADPTTNPEAVEEFNVEWEPFGPVNETNVTDALEKEVVARIVSRASSRARLQVFLQSGGHLRVFVGTRPEDFDSPDGRTLCVGSEFLLTDNNDPVWAVALEDGYVEVVEDFC